MTPSEQLAVRVRRLLASVLPHGLGVEVQPFHAAGPAFEVTVKAGATNHHFVVGWAGEGWPSDVERIVHLVPDVDVVTAAHVSDGARRWLEREGLGWADEAGRADISMESGLVIFRQPSLVRKGREPSMRWTRSTLAVAEAALSGITPTVECIEQATELSRHATANALSRLEDLGFLERPHAFVVRNLPGGLSTTALSLTPMPRPRPSNERSNPTYSCIACGREILSRRWPWKSGLR